MSRQPIPSNGVETSDAAAESLKEKVGRLRMLVFQTVQKRGPLTCDEIEEITGLMHQTASARVYDLRNAGRLEDSGQRRLTRSKRRAIVWKVVTDVRMIVAKRQPMNRVKCPTCGSLRVARCISPRQKK